MAKKDSPYRTATIDENLRLWKEMQKGSEEGLKCCVRAKIDMQSNNGALRDPATFRCNLTPHHQTKEKYKVDCCGCSNRESGAQLHPTSHHPAPPSTGVPDV